MRDLVIRPTWIFIALLTLLVSPALPLVEIPKALAAEPIITTSPSDGAPGTHVTITGQGWNSSYPVWFYWDDPNAENGIVLGETQPSASGSLSFSFDVPKGASKGSHSIFAVSDEPSYCVAVFPNVCFDASTTFTVNCSAPSGLDTCLLRKGDILLETSPRAGLAGKIAIHGVAGSYWFHAGLYDGEGNVLEAAGTSPSAPDDEVRKFPLQDHDFFTSTEAGYDLVVLRVKPEYQSKIDGAVNWAEAKASDPNVRFNILASRDQQQEFYCSLFVWRAYKEQGLDLDFDSSIFNYSQVTRILKYAMVLPDDLFATSSGSKAVTDQVFDLNPGKFRWFVGIFSPADLWVVDAAGRAIGVDPVTGLARNDIPGAMYSGPNEEPETVAFLSDTVPSKIEVRGTGEGSYNLAIQVYRGGLIEGNATENIVHIGNIDSFTISDPRAGSVQFQPAGDSACTYFAETKHNFCAGFRDYWHSQGLEFGDAGVSFRESLALFGYPITEEFQENGLTVQYFERARFEYHPELPEPYKILLGRLGADVVGQRLQEPPFEPIVASNDANCRFYPETGHRLCFGIRDYWDQNGGLPVFGYPLSEEFQENGLTVQYFERQRLEWHPEYRGTPYEVLLGRLGAEAYERTTGSTPSEGPIVIAQGLNNPRGLHVGPGGVLYVAEAGSGGSGPCTRADDGGDICYGATGAITRVSQGRQERWISGLPSIAGRDGTFAVGPHAVSVNSGGGSVWAVIGDLVDPNDPLETQSMSALFGTVIEVNGQNQVREAADLAAYERASNPDGLGGNSNPYSVLDLGSARVIADAGGNDLLAVDANGNISVIAVFPTREVDAPPFLNLPPGTRIPAEAVPTSVVRGPDGAYYVGEFTGFPFPVGGARVWRVVPGEMPTVYAGGFTNIISIAFGPDGSLYVLEMVTGGLLAAEGVGTADDPAWKGALIRIRPSGSRSTVLSDGLVAPGGVAIGTDNTVYLTNFSIFSGRGEVLQIRQ